MILKFSTYENTQQIKNLIDPSNVILAVPLHILHPKESIINKQRVLFNDK